jgi:tRNA threonylcarbamoyladenosine biosynthesis protein TsaE
MADMRKFFSHSEEETTDLGRRIGEACSGGELIGLIGPLGAGKSVLARGIARGIGIDGPVRSPSFNLMREYHGRLILRHWDLYRLDRGFDTLGLLESVDDTSLAVVEWADRWPDLKNYLSGTIFMEFGETETDRIITWTGDVPGMPE